MLRDPNRTAGRSSCILASVMGDSQIPRNHRTSVRPDVRMVGDSVVLVLPVFSAPTAGVHADLILRFDPAGEMFAALDWRPIERPR
jgi:hypothetical protein